MNGGYQSPWGFVEPRVLAQACWAAGARWGVDPKCRRQVELAVRAAVARAAAAAPDGRRLVDANALNLSRLVTDGWAPPRTDPNSERR